MSKKKFSIEIKCEAKKKKKMQYWILSNIQLLFTIIPAIQIGE